MTTSQPSQQEQAPAYGQRPLPWLIDEIAREDPNKLFLKYPTSSNFSSKLRDVTYRDFARAIDNAAWWLERTLGGKGTNFPTLAYIGPTDIRYQILSIAAPKASYKLLLPSPRNSIAHHLHILQTTDCNVFLSDSGFNALDILAERKMKHIIVPSVDEFLEASNDVPHYPYTRSLEEVKNDPALILHSSGSTGPPKTITWTERSFASMDTAHLLPLSADKVPLAIAMGVSKLDFCPFPPHHAAGLLLSLAMTVYYDRPVLLPPSGASVNVPLILDALEHTNIETMTCPPSLLEEMSADPDALAKLEKLDKIWFGGGPLAHEAGEIIRKHVAIGSGIGSTEVGWYPNFDRDPEDWDYFHFDPNLKGFEMRPAGDGLYELVIVRDGSTDEFHFAWSTFPDDSEYATKDLYEKHPVKPNHWAARGRSDDVLILSNGEKVVPGPVQDMLKESPEIYDALLIGHSRFEVAALIELEPNFQKLSYDELLQILSPLLKHINQNVPKWYRLAKDHIIFMSADKPMTRTDKGTVIRKKTIAAYQPEIDKMYEEAGSQQRFKLPLLKDTTEDDTVKALLDLFGRVSDLQDAEPDKDIFVAGFDSQGVMASVRQLKAQVESENVGVSARAITPTLVYSNPIPRQLAIALRNLAHTSTDSASQEKARLRAMQDMLDQYSRDLPEKLERQPSKEEKLTVVLTGSTGSLGSYLLDSLLRSDKVSHIYCLNRSEDGHNRQLKASSSRSLSCDWGDRVTFLHADLSQSTLGLSSSDLSALKLSTSVIIHNQWQVDFNLAITSFTPHVKGVRNLMNLAATSPKNPPIIFTSTVSTIGNWVALHPDSPKAPEEPIHDMRVPMPIGYAESKHVSERLLELSAAHSGVRAAVCRVGQVAGPAYKRGGVWNKQEWFPTLAVSSAYLHVFPSSLGGVATVSDATPAGQSDADATLIDWVPVDILADVLVDLSLPRVEEPESTLHVYNLSNPHAVPYSSLMPTILKHLPGDTQVVSFPDWVRRLSASAEVEGHQDIVRNPGLKLLEFYQSLADGAESGEAGGISMSVEKTVQGSKAMRELNGVSQEWMGSWLEGWGLKERAE